MPSYDSALEEIKARVDIVDLISEYVHLKQAGQNWKGLCPFHTEKTPSFTVSPAKQIYHCFGCGNGGDIFTFIVRYENISFPEALGILAKKAGVTLKESRKGTMGTGEKETLLNMHRDATRFFQQSLAKNSKAGDYLRGRGIGSDIQEMFSLGYAVNSWNALLTHLTHKGYKTETIRKAGLANQGSKGTYDTFRDRIVFPICDFKGDVVAFGGRSIDGSEPKYLNSPETTIFNKRRVLYGLDRARNSIKQAGYALLMEGYLDVITAHIHGFSNSVAPLGTALTQEQGKLIKRFTENATIVFDSDQAGIKAAKNAANVLLESGLNVEVLSVPDKEDPDSLLRKKGKETFQKLLENPLSVVDFFIRQGGSKHLIAREALETISRAPDNILQDEYIKMLSEKLNVNERNVRDEFKKIKKQIKGGYKKSSPPPPRHKRRPGDELYIIKLLLQMPEKAGEVSGILPVGDFKDSTLRSIFEKIKNGITGFNELVARCEGEEKDLLTEVSLSDDIEEPEKALSDCIRRFQEKKKEAILKDLQVRIKDAESRKDRELLDELLTQCQLIKSGKI